MVGLCREQPVSCELNKRNPRNASRVGWAHPASQQPRDVVQDTHVKAWSWASPIQAPHESHTCQLCNALSVEAAPELGGSLAESWRGNRGAPGFAVNE